MAVKELGHLVLYVSNLERSRHFYQDVLGWDTASAGDEPFPFPAIAFSSGRTHHELLLIEVGPTAAPLPRGHRLGLYHFGVKVGDTDDELRAMLQTLIDNDITIVGSADHQMTHSLYVLDPDGNEVELYIDVAGVDWKDPALWADPRPRPLRL